MLNAHSEPDYYLTPTEFSDRGEEFGIKQGIATVWRQWPLIAIVTGFMLMLAIAYLITAPSKYTASTTILIDTHTNQVFEKDGIIVDRPIDSLFGDTQLEVAKSESVLLSVARKLRLTKDPEFISPDRDLIQIIIGTIKSLFSWDRLPQLDPEMQAERNAIGTLVLNLTVERVAQTYAIEFDYMSQDAAKSAQIANAIADAYVLSDFDARFLATRRTAEWLQDRIKELGTLSTAADEAVRKYKEENNLINTSQGLMSQQQLTDVNTQLIQARLMTAEAKAKLDSIQNLGEDVTDIKISDALRSDVISKLRTQYLDLRTKEANFASRFGQNHLATVNLRTLLRDVAQSIRAELSRITETYSSDYKLALAREKSIEASLNELALQAAGPTGRAQDKLRVLESTAQTYRSLYETFLQRATAAAEQQSFSVSGARVITLATPPVTKSSPKSLVILGGATILGSILGGCAAFARERMDNTFRRGAQIEQLTGLECLGIIPKIALQQNEKCSLGPDRTLPLALGVFRYATESPFSRFAETLRSVKLAADISKIANEVRILGFISALPQEGKTITAINFAALFAQVGCKTLLIDGDLRHTSVTRALIGDVNRGLIAAIQDPEALRQVIWRDPVSGFDFLPAETGLHISHTSEIISSARMAEILARVRSSYDYVILDLPPITPVVDVKAISHLIDKFIMVVEWGKTNKEAVLEALNKLGSARERVLGIVLNKANPTMLKRHEIYLGRYYNSYYNNENTASGSKHGDQQVLRRKWWWARREAQEEQKALRESDSKSTRSKTKFPPSQRQRSPAPKPP